MKRRASSEIFGVMAVGAALAIAMGIIMQSSVELVYGGKVTVRDTMDEYKGQISELVQVVGTFNNPASVELINYGSSPIIIDQVRIDSEIHRIPYTSTMPLEKFKKLMVWASYMQL